MGAWAKFLFSFLLPQKFNRRTEVSISSKPMLCEVANTNFKKSKNSLAILHNVPQVYFVGGFGTRNYQLTEKLNMENRTSLTDETANRIKPVVRRSFKRRRLFAEYRSEKNPNFDTIELAFSCLHFISGNYRWFCRIWDKDWIDKIGRGKKEFGESYGKNKFEAYRLALKDLREGRKNYA